MRVFGGLFHRRGAYRGGFCGDRRGIAAVEFALILPIMTLLFFGMLEASDLMTVKRKIANAANSLSDLLAQEPQVSVAQLDDAIAGVTRMLEPTDTSTITIRVVSVTKGPNNGDPPTVHWSIGRAGDPPYTPGPPPYTPGSTYVNLDDDSAIDPNASLVVVEIDYVYDSGLGGRVFDTPFVFVQEAKRFPRKSSRVQLCQTADPATCTN